MRRDGVRTVGDDGGPVPGAVRVVASAGTGKTWMVAHLALRLIVCDEVPIQRLLVTTFTNAATAEMAGRIRRRLEAARAFVEARAAGYAVDREDTQWRCGGAMVPEQDGLVLEVVSVEVARRRLAAALRDFDLATLTTIHGFCQRMLSQWAFELGVDGQRALGTLPASVGDRLLRDFLAVQDYRDPTGMAKGVLDLVLAHPDAVVAPAREVAERWTVEALAELRDRWRVRWDAVEVRRRLKEAGVAGGSITVLCKKLDKFAQASGEELVGLGSLAVGSGGRPNKGDEAYAVCFAEDAELLRAFDGLRSRVADGAKVLAALDLVDWTRDRREAVLGELQLLPFDDLLRTLRDALAGPGGDGLQARIRGQFDAVIVDEFQDTDPVQAEIFERLFLVGDAVGG